MLGTSLRVECGEHRAVHILARTISRELLSQGYEPHHLVELASELLDLACESLHATRAAAPSGR
jgi:hypothetical protein